MEHPENKKAVGYGMETQVFEQKKRIQELEAKNDALIAQVKWHFDALVQARKKNTLHRYYLAGFILYVVVTFVWYNIL